MFLNKPLIKLYNNVVSFQREPIATTQIKASGNQTAEILIYEDIGESWYGGMSAKTFADQLNALGDLNEIKVNINSSGGNVFDGVAIYNTLLKHKAKVIVNIDGMALSIASIIAMAGDEIHMADNALMMIHDPWGYATGNANELRATADLMDTVKTNLVSTYVKKTGMANDQMSTLMTEETWMTATEALAFGFIDNITGAKIEKLAAHFDPKRFKNAPADLIKSAQAQGKPNLRNHQYSAALMQKRALQISRERKKTT